MNNCLIPNTPSHAFLKSEPDIKAWLDEMQIQNYTLIPDRDLGFVVNVAGPVLLKDKNLNHIPVQFNCVSSYFDCSHNQLQILKGCPRIVRWFFGCDNNALTSLKGCPSFVQGDFSCASNVLKNLRGSENIKVGGWFNCNNNAIENLEFFPRHVGKDFHCNDNPLLGEVQHVTNFEEIHKLHEEFHRIRTEKNLLSHYAKVSSDNLQTIDHIKKPHKI